MRMGEFYQGSGEVWGVRIYDGEMRFRFRVLGFGSLSYRELRFRFRDCRMREAQSGLQEPGLGTYSSLCT